MAVTFVTVTRAGTGPTPVRTFAFYPLTDGHIITVAAEDYEHVGPFEVTTDTAGAFTINIPTGLDQGDVVWRIEETPVDRIAGRLGGPTKTHVIGTALITANIDYDDLIAELITPTAVTPDLVENVGTLATQAQTAATTATTKATEASGYADAALDSAANADSSADLAAASETAAASSASTASTAATTATTKAGEASTAAATATTKAGEASTSAATATTKAEEADASATAAEGHAAAAAGSVSLVAWAPGTAYSAGDVRQAPDGTTIRRDANGTSGASFDAGEQAAWTPVSAVPGTLENTALAATFVRTISPLDLAYGAAGDDTTDDTVALTAAIAAAPAIFTTVDLRGLTYLVTDEIEVPAGVKVCNGTIHQTGTAKKTLVPSGNVVTIKDVSGVGRHATATASADEYFIYAEGASAAAPLLDLHIENVSAELFGQHGVYMKWVTKFGVRRCDFGELGYAAIATLSCIDGDILDNRIENVLAGFSGNGYGIILTRHPSSSLVDDPRSSNIRVHGNTVNGVPWNGIDTHGGEDITISGNHVFNCLYGIAVGSCPNGAAVATYAPLGVEVTDNLIEDCTGAGVLFTGATGATSTDPATQYATGVIGSNTIRRCGDETNNNLGGIMLQNTAGVAVTGNHLDQPAPHGITLYFDNRGFVISGNAVLDAWTNTVGVGAASAVATRGANNSGTVAGNSQYTTGAKAGATYVNTRGLNLSGTGGQDIILGPNDFSAAASPVSGAGSKARFYSPIEAAVGAVGAPGISWAGDTDTGLYWEAADQFAAAVGGVRAIRLYKSGAAQVLELNNATNLVLGTGTGSWIGSGPTQVMGFWGGTRGTQPAAVADASGGATVDTEARTAINTLLARLRSRGFIAT